MDAKFFRNIRRKALLKAQQEQARDRNAGEGVSAAVNSVAAATIGHPVSVAGERREEEGWGAIPLPSRKSTGRVLLCSDSVAAEGLDALKELKGHMDYFVNVAAGSIAKTVEVEGLKGELEAAQKKVSDVEGAFREEQEEARRLRKANVHSAIKIGEASSKLAETRQSRDKVFASTQEQIDEANRQCEERIRKHEAETSNKIRWLQEGLEHDRQHKSWLWDELTVARNRLASLEPSAILDTLRETEMARDDYKERLEAAEKELARKEKVLAKCGKLRRREDDAAEEIESLRKRLDVKEKKLRRVLSERDDISLHNMDLLSKMSVIEAKILAAEKGAHAKVEAMARTVQAAEEWVKVMERDTAASGERARIAEARLEALKKKAQIDPADAYLIGFKECKELAVQIDPRAADMISLPLEPGIQADFLIRKAGPDEAPFDLNK